MVNPNIPQVFGRDMRRIAFLENAMTVSYDMPLNALWTASFSLPIDDEKNQYCQPLNYIRLYDGDEYVDLFRIIREDLTRGTDSIRVYQCEHVLATLLNDILFKYHQIGGYGVRTAEVLRYVLGKQSLANWQLEQCDFSRQFEYNWENSNLLAALFSIPQCFDDEYRWEWDTTGYPWSISLKAVDAETKAEIRYGKNMTSIIKSVDVTNMFNRVYALGYGEGVNQLTIEEANNGIPYLEDEGSIATYGLLSTILVDSRFEYADTLKGYAQTLLSRYKEPYISYEVSALDLYRLTKAAYTKFRPGDMVKVVDTEDGITVTTRITNVSKNDLRGDGGQIDIVLANKPEDIATSISDLQNRALINETYAQGATNLMMQSYADNADSSNRWLMVIVQKKKNHFLMQTRQ